MCGIFALLKGTGITTTDMLEARKSIELMRNRGPDASNILNGPNYILGHTRLAIQGGHLFSAQPLTTGTHLLCVNGEIYNWKELCSSHGVDADTMQSDCDVVLACFVRATQGGNAILKHPQIISLLTSLDGIFSFVYLNTQTKQVIAARSRFGVMPLYFATRNDEHNKTAYFASERKALPVNVDTCIQVRPGYFLEGTAHNFNKAKWGAFRTLPPPMASLSNIMGIERGGGMGIMDLQKFKDLLSAAIRKRIKAISTDVKYGFLLSGGLDSSATVALAREILGPEAPILTFSIGLSGGEGTGIDSPDLRAAQSVATHLNTVHTSYTFTVQEGLSAVPEVIAAIETLDITTVRASTPMWLLAQKIKADHPDLKVLVSGEGADELLGGYLCFHQAPRLTDSDTYSLKLLELLNYFDVQRSHFALIAHSIEARVPFLDDAFVDYVLSLHPIFRTPICRQEKYWLRRAVQHLLPSSIVDRVKEQFSDGVGYRWIDILRDGTWHELENNKEELRKYREPVGREQENIFDIFLSRFGRTHFKQLCEGVGNWKPAWSKSEDASGRVADMHPTKHEE